MIRLEGVRVPAGSFELRDISLEVPAGGYALLIGPTGAGKTTLLEAIAGHLAPAAGRILLHGEDVTLRPAEARGVGFVYQDHLLFPHLSVAENIGYGLGAPTALTRPRVLELADALGIAHLLGRTVERLSGGEKQRVALARALAPRPKVLLLDEPFASLDPGTRATLRHTLIALQQSEGVTILQVSHDFDEALRLGDLVAVLAEGRIIQMGSPEAVFHRPNSAFVARFTGVGNVLQGEVKATGAPETDGRFMARFTTGPLELDVVAERTGPLHAVIRPEDVLVSREPVGTTRNHLRGMVERIERVGPVAYIHCDAGRPLVAVITALSADEMALVPGVEVSLSIKATAVLLV